MAAMQLSLIGMACRSHGGGLRDEVRAVPIRWHDAEAVAHIGERYRRDS